MTRRFPLLRHSALAILTTAGLFLACAPMAHAQHSRGSGSNSGSSTSGGGNSSGGGQASSGGQSDSGSSGGGHSRSAPAAAPAPTSSRGSDGASGHAVPRNSGASSGTTRSGNSEPTAVTRNGSNDNSGASTDSSGGRSRDGRTTVGRAVPRPVTAIGGGTTVIVSGGGYGGYYPWGYGGLGFYGYYDPWWYDPYPPVYSGGGYDYDGSLRLKVKPRDASVYVDGYYAGHVDNFDGVFQSLKVESGPHRVEIRLDGYEPLSFDVRIDPDRKTTYEGELRKLP